MGSRFSKRLRIPEFINILKRRRSQIIYDESDEESFMPEDGVFISCQNLVKIYRILDLEVMALQGLDLTVREKELIAIIGRSGSGKSTLMNILGGLDTPTAGKVRVGERNLAKMKESDLIHYRLNEVGFVWQNVSRNLIPFLTALENVELPMILTGRLDRNRAQELLEIVGLKDRMNHLPHQMSGGEQQRVAIAIGLANNPRLLLADEPTGSLDSASARIVLDALHRVRDAYGVTIIIVTHDIGMARMVDRYVKIQDGKISMESVKRVQNGNAKVSGTDEESSDISGGFIEGWGEVTHDEFVVLDSAGRLQIPPELKDELGIKDRVKLEMKDGTIILRPPE